MYKKKGFKRLQKFLTVWLLVFALVPLLGITSVYADDDEEEKGDSFSLYDRSELLSKVFGQSMGMDDDGKARKNGLLLTNDGRGVGTGQAAGVMGYTDAKKGFNIANVIAKNSVTYSLEQLKKLKVKGMASGADPTLDSYAEYGLSLKNAGLDKTSSTFSFGSGMLDKVVYLF